MTKRPLPLACGLAALLGLAALAANGCKGSGDAPTNTQNSTYQGGGNTEADKISDQMRKNHRRGGGSGQP